MEHVEGTFKNEIKKIVKAKEKRREEIREGFTPLRVRSNPHSGYGSFLASAFGAMRVP
jgi:hypothetical protein